MSTAPKMRINTTVIYSCALLVLGAGIGSGGTLLAQRWTSPPGAQRPAPPPERAPKLTADLAVMDEPQLGQDTAPLTIVEFSDFECPYCQRFHQEVLPKLKTTYIKPGLVRFIHKDLPLPFHAQAKPAAAASRCAGEQGQYWSAYAALFDQQTCLECKGVVEIVAGSGVNEDKLKACMERPSTTTAINTNISEAGLHNIRATPTFVIGATLGNGKHGGTVVEGALPWPQFKALIEQQLKAIAKP